MIQPKSTILSEAHELLKCHREDDPSTLGFLFSGKNDNEIKLLEVTKLVSTLNELFPYTFPPSEEDNITHQCTLIMVSPEDWEKVIKLPENWNLNRYTELA